jgi:hypothetical protein
LQASRAIEAAVMLRLSLVRNMLPFATFMNDHLLYDRHAHRLALVNGNTPHGEIIPIGEDRQEQEHCPQ